MKVYVFVQTRYMHCILAQSSIETDLKTDGGSHLRREFTNGSVSRRSCPCSSVSKVCVHIAVKCSWLTSCPLPFSLSCTQRKERLHAPKGYILWLQFKLNKANYYEENLERSVCFSCLETSDPWHWTKKQTNSTRRDVKPNTGRLLPLCFTG